MTTVATLAPVVTVPRLWPGCTAVVIGGGPSLTPADVAYCEGKARVVAVKEGYLLAPWADVLYACEAKWWAYYDGAPTFKGLKFGLEAVPYPDVQVLTHSGAFGLERDPSAIRHGYNSGFQAVNLAVHLGAAKVVLLGFDLWRDPETGEQNWFGPHPNHDQPSPYPIFLHAFTTMAEPLRDAGVTVINASRRTALKTFPRMLLKEALA